MIKVEYLDDDFNEVKPENATRIVYLHYNDKEIVTKRTEWVPKNKTGYPESHSSLKKKVDYESLSKELSKHYLGSLEDIQTVLKICWKNHLNAKGIALQNKILKTILDAHNTYVSTLSTTRYALDEEIRKSQGRW